MPRRIPERRFGRDVNRRERRFGRYYSSGPRSEASPPREAPVKEGEEYDVSIEAMGQKGDGLAKIQGFAVFVPGTKLGDKPRVRIENVRGNFAVASVVEGVAEGEPESASTGEEKQTDEGGIEGELGSQEGASDAD